MTRRCAYCGAKTEVLPLQGMRSSQFSRAPHSPLKAKFPPICAAVQQGVAAARRTRDWTAA